MICCRTFIFIGLLTASLVACAQRAVPASNCVAQDLLDVTRIKQQVILVGELHGSREIPAFVGGLVCSLLKDHRSVILALERDGSEQADLNRFIGSSDGATAMQEITGARSWHSACSDGRNSVAMLELLDGIRRLRQEGQRVAVRTLHARQNLNILTTEQELQPFPPDDNALANVIGDREMANTLLMTAIEHRTYTVVSLTGFVHASTVDGMRRMHRYTPFGMLVSQDVPTFIVGLRSSGGGQVWAYHSEGCRAWDVPAGPLYAEGTHIDAEVDLPTLTASPPAVATPAKR